MADEVLGQFQQAAAEKKIDSSRKLKVGIIGTGWIAESHIQQYNVMPDVEVVAMADLIPGQHRAHRQVFSRILSRGYRRGAHNARGSGKSASGTLHHYQHEDAVRKYAQ